MRLSSPLCPQDELNSDQRLPIAAHDQASVPFRQCRWHEAEAGSAAISIKWPEDGPVRFHQAQCRRLAVGPPAGDWNSYLCLRST